MAESASIIKVCGNKPNCVSSMDSREEFHIQAINLNPNEDFKTLISKIKEIVSKQQRTQLISETKNYLHYEFKSAVFRFIDDVEFYLDPNKQQLHMRSASRTGHSDFGVNRKRLEKIKTLILQK